MEQAISRPGRKSGWSEMENKLLWETADEAQQQGLPLKAVFDRIAERTGRRPNSIRNYYYAQVREREGGREHAARFVPFTQEEVDWLMEQVLTARAEGQSVRSCLQKLANGDHSLMLRYQNKYRSVIKSRPDYVRQMVERLNENGVRCDQPHVNHRTRPDVREVCGDLMEDARLAGDVELARAMETVAKRLRGAGNPAGIARASQNLLRSVKEFLARPQEEKAQYLTEFSEEIAGLAGELESLLPEENAL